MEANILAIELMSLTEISLSIGAETACLEQKSFVREGHCGSSQYNMRFSLHAFQTSVTYIHTDIQY
jgi:hypothetical protein